MAQELDSKETVSWEELMLQHDGAGSIVADTGKKRYCDKRRVS